MVLWNSGFMVPLDFRIPRTLMLPFCPYPWIFGFLRCLALPGTGGVRRSGVVWHVGSCFSAVVMPLFDSDVPMSVPITFRNKQPFHVAAPELLT